MERLWPLTTVWTGSGVNDFSAADVETWWCLHFRHLHDYGQIKDALAVAAQKMGVLGLGWQLIAFGLTGVFQTDELKVFAHLTNMPIDGSRTESCDQAASGLQNFVACQRSSSMLQYFLYRSALSGGAHGRS